MYFCVECQEIVNNDSTNSFSYYDSLNKCHNVCNICYLNINNRLKILNESIDYDKLVLLKRKIYSKTIRMYVSK